MKVWRGALTPALARGAGRTEGTPSDLAALSLAACPRKLKRSFCPTVGCISYKSDPFQSKHAEQQKDVLFIDCLRMSTAERNKKKKYSYFIHWRSWVYSKRNIFLQGVDLIWDFPKFMFIYSNTTSLELERLQSCISGTRSRKILSPSDSWVVLYIKNTSTSGKRAQHFKLVLSGGMATAGAETSTVAWTSARQCQLK